MKKLDKSDKSENNLAERIRRGDKAAEEILITKYQERLRYFVQRWIGTSTEDWQDVLQDALTHIIKSLREGKFKTGMKKSGLGSYIYAIAWNKIKDHFNKKTLEQKRSINYSDCDTEMETIPDPALGNALSNLIASEDRAILKREIGRLPIQQKEIFDLIMNEGLSRAEIAEQLKLPPRVVSERKHAALEKLKKRIRKKRL